MTQHDAVLDLLLEPFAVHHGHPGRVPLQPKSDEYVNGHSWVVAGTIDVQQFLTAYLEKLHFEFEFLLFPVAVLSAGSYCHRVARIIVGYYILGLVAKLNIVLPGP